MKRVPILLCIVSKNLSPAVSLTAHVKVLPKCLFATCSLPCKMLYSSIIGV